jgi:hypothetical protein
MRARDQVQRYNRPYLADRMPQPRWLRRTGGTGWSVPLVTVSVDVAGQPLERIRAAVDAVLHGTERDLRVCLAGPWHTLGSQRVSPLRDPLLDLRLIAETYRSDPRVRLVEQAPETAFPSPFLLDMQVSHGLPGAAVRRLVDLIDRDQLGLLRVSGPDGGPGVRLWRTAALSRALLVRRAGESPADVVDEVYGSRDVDAATVGLVDLSAFSAQDLAGGVGAAADPDRGTGRWLPGTVEVGGMRSLGRAAALVAQLSMRTAATRIRRATVVRRPAVTRTAGTGHRHLREDG